MAKDVHVGVTQSIPVTGSAAGGLDVQERVYNLTERTLLVLAEGMYDEGVAEMEHRLLAEAKLSDGRVVGCLDALAECKDAAPVFLAELAVVDDRDSGLPEKRVIGLGPAPPSIEPDTACSSIVGVL